MYKRTLRVIALLCVYAFILCIFSSCRDYGLQGSSDSSLPLTLAEQIEKEVVEVIKELEDKGKTIDEINTISQSAGYLSSLVLESRGFIAIPDANGPDSFAYTYDNAAAIIALTYADAHWYAQKIADALVYAMNNDRSFNDGRLRNAYMRGDPKGNAGWSIVKQKEVVKVAGCWENDRWKEDYYGVSSSTGNIAWVILALCHVYLNAPADKAEEYLTSAKRAAEFVLNLSSDEGGFTGGYEGWDDNQEKMSYKSTEHNIDLISAFLALAKLTEKSDPEKSKQYLSASKHAKDFVFSMYNSEGHYFYTGTKDDGITTSKIVLPLDTNTWAILVLGDEFFDPSDIISFIEENISVGEGFDFSAGDLTGIWHEGTAQMAVCYKVLGNSLSYNRVMNYLSSQMEPDGSITAASRDGLSTGFFVSGTEVLWEYNNTINLGATNWLAFAQMGANPFLFKENS